MIKRGNNKYNASKYSSHTTALRAFLHDISVPVVFYCSRSTGRFPFARSSPKTFSTIVQVINNAFKYANTMVKIFCCFGSVLDDPSTYYVFGEFQDEVSNILNENS